MKLIEKYLEKASVVWILEILSLLDLVNLGKFVFQGCLLLLSCVYCPPGSRTCNFQEEFMSFVGFLSSINSSYYI